MSDNANIDPHSALTSLWPSDTEESKKLAEEKQQKRQNLVEIGNQFKLAREELGYNVSDLNDHTGLSFTELEAMEQGLFQHIEQQDYVEYYVHTYASLLNLDAAEILNNFKQNYYQADADEVEVDTQSDFDIHDEGQYEDAFTEEAKKTLEALDASDVNALKAANQLEIEQDVNTEFTEKYIEEVAQEYQIDEPQAQPTQQEIPTEEFVGFNELQADTIDEPITSDHNLQQRKPFPWLKLFLSFIFVLLAAIVAYFASTQFDLSQLANNQSSISTAIPQDGATTNNNVIIDNSKNNERIPEGQKAKKIGTLESKVTVQGSDDLNAPTAEMVQKPLILMDEKPATSTGELSQSSNAAKDADTKDADAKNIGDIISEATAEAKPITQTDEDLTKAAELAKAASATKAAAEQAKEQAAKQAEEQAKKQVSDAATSTAETALPENSVQEALAQLPADNSKYSLHATKNNWVLIEDDSAQILFSGELTPEKIVTLPKIQGVIISLGNAGVIDVYKGKKLLGRLGKQDESLDLVSVEQRFNQISN